MKYFLLLFLSFTGLAQPLPLYSVRTAPQSAPLLLDLFPGASIAYSLRRLNSTYTGPLIRIQPDGVTNQYDIGSVGFDLDKAAAVFATTNLVSHTAFVAKWYDQSGNGNDAVANDGGTNNVYMPTIVNADAVYTYGTRPSMFNGQTDGFNFNLTTPLSGAQPWAMSAIWQRGWTTDLNKHLVFLVNKTAAPQILTDSPGTLLATAILYTDTTSHYSSYDTGTNLFAIMAVFATASAESVYFGPTQQTPLVNHSANAGSSNFEALGSYGASTVRHNGSMQEVIFWNSDQSANRLAIFTNQNTYFQQYP